MFSLILKQRRRLSKLFSDSTSEKHVKLLTWTIILSLIIVRFFISFNAAAAGDEPYYIDEVKYMSRHGVYLALCQGTSLLYSVLIYSLAKILSVDFLASAKILSVIFFLMSSQMLFRYLDQFKGMNTAVKYFAITVFAALSKIWLWRALPDLICVFFMLSCFRLLISERKNGQFLAGLMLFCAAIVKPVALFAIAGFVIFLFLKSKGLPRIQRSIMCLSFIATFVACFAIYHIPGYMRFGKLMLEDKWHYYEGTKRVEVTPTWRELNVYFEVYKDYHQKSRKWEVSFPDVAAFKLKHPEIKLELSYPAYVSTHTKLWIKNVLEKGLLDLNLMTQNGFFFYKYTSLNHLIGDYFLIKVFAFLLFLTSAWFTRDFIRANLLLFTPPFFYAVCLCAYLIPQLEDNWFLWITPFIALPIAKALCEKINIIVLLALQGVYLLIL